MPVLADAYGKDILIEDCRDCDGTGKRVHVKSSFLDPLKRLEWDEDCFWCQGKGWVPFTDRCGEITEPL